MKGTLLFLFSLLFSGNYKGTLVHELDVPLPASEVWEVYGTLRMAKISVELIPGAKLEVEEGEGGVGTVILVTFPPGSPGPSSYQKEKFVKVDNEQRVKEVVLMEGGMLDYGFTSYLFRFEIIKKANNSCTIKSSVEYEIDEEHVANIAYINPEHLAALAEAVSKYLMERNSDS